MNISSYMFIYNIHIWETCTMSNRCVYHWHQFCPDLPMILPLWRSGAESPYLNDENPHTNFLWFMGVSLYMGMYKMDEALWLSWWIPIDNPRCKNGWLVGGLEHFYFPRHIGFRLSSQLTKSYFSGRGFSPGPPTSNDDHGAFLKSSYAKARSFWLSCGPSRDDRRMF